MNAFHRDARNVVVDGHRTSMRLERWVWDALDDIGAREGKTLNELVTEISRRAQSCSEAASSLSSAVRVFAMSYYRAAVPASHRLDHGLEGLLDSLLKTRKAPPRKKPGRQARATGMSSSRVV